MYMHEPEQTCMSARDVRCSKTSQILLYAGLLVYTVAIDSTCAVSQKHEDDTRLPTPNRTETPNK